MRVLLTITSLLPSQGGPPRTVARLAQALVDANCTVGLFAADQSAGQTSFLPAASRVVRLAGTPGQALDQFGADVLHDNGIWLPHNHHLARLARQRKIARIISTRGMLEPWALQHKRLKKRIAWWLYQRADLRSAGAHHATSLTEARNLEAHGFGVPVRMIPNGVDLPETSDDEPMGRRDHRGAILPLSFPSQFPLSPPRVRTALFVGRIYPVKGLPMLVQAWARIRPAGWRMRIVGPDEAGHQAQVQQQIATAGLEAAFVFDGALDGAEKARAFREAELFILPSHSESFGLAIAEALAHELPVLTTRGAPWPMLRERGCGWWVEATVEGIADGLQAATSLDRQTLQDMGARGAKLVAQEFSWSSVAEQFVDLYEHVIQTRG